MATPINIDILKNLGFDENGFAQATPSDLVIAFQLNDDSAKEAVLEAIENLMNTKKAKGSKDKRQTFTSTSQAMAEIEDSNFVIFSIPGAHVARESIKALNAGKNIMIFSDNISIEDEVKVKDLAIKKISLL
ncbi:MAG: hypothetical protein ACRCTJ_04180 [Brevinema sp.]